MSFKEDYEKLCNLTYQIIDKEDDLEELRKQAWELRSGIESELDKKTDFCVDLKGRIYLRQQRENPCRIDYIYLGDMAINRLYNVLRKLIDGEES